MIPCHHWPIRNKKALATLAVNQDPACFIEVCSGTHALGREHGTCIHIPHTMELRLERSSQVSEPCTTQVRTQHAGTSIELRLHLISGNREKRFCGLLLSREHRRGGRNQVESRDSCAGRLPSGLLQDGHRPPSQPCHL